MQQETDVNTYIALKSEAALLATALTPQIHLFGFLHGLKEDIRSYVDLQRPKTLEAAEQYARAYERSQSGIIGKRRKASSSGSRSATEPEVKKTKTKPGTGATETSKIWTPEKRAALNELRTIKGRDNCYACGVKGHMAQSCPSGEEEKKAFKAKVEALKEKLNTT